MSVIVGANRPWTPTKPTGTGTRTRQQPTAAVARWSTTLNVAALCIGAVVLAGWATGTSWAINPISGWAPMTPVAAGIVCLLAGSRLLSTRAGRAMAAAAAATSMAAIIDLALPGSVHAAWGPAPVGHGTAVGYISPLAAMLLLSLSLSKLASTTECRQARLRTIVLEIGAIAPLPFVLATLLGYGFARPDLTGFPTALPLSFPGAIAIAVLSLSAVTADPEGTVMNALRGDDPGARLLRRIIPSTVLALPLLAALRLAGQRAGWYDSEVGLALMTTAAVLSVTVASWLIARQLRCSHHAREHVLAELRDANLDLDHRVRTRAAEVAASRHEADLARDRERISADLHDLVIQRLFGVALTLQVKGNADTLTDDDVDGAIDGIDAAIAELRGTIFNLRSASPDAVLKQTVSEAVDLAQEAGLETHLRVIGDLGTLPGPVQVHLTAVIRECVSNATRHSGGTRLAIKIITSADEVSLLVADDGRGMDPDIEAPSGLRNVRARALDLGGHATWSVNAPVGTRVTWTVPLAQGAAAPATVMKATLTADSPEQPDPSVDTEALLATLDGDDPLPAHQPWTSHPDAVTVPEPLRRLARGLARALDADRVAVITEDLGDKDQLIVSFCENFPDGAHGMRYHRNASLVARALAADTCLTFAHVATASATGARLLTLPDGSALIIPLVAGAPGDHASLAITLLRDEGRRPYNPADVTAGNTAVAALRRRLLGRAPEQPGAS